jgi:glycine hydroxymethyltransferase
LIAGWSAYPRRLDFARFREIADEVGALLMVDMAHFAGLVATGLHPNPLDYGADVATTTTHKTLGGPRAGIILCKESLAKKIDSAVFPGQQGGPLEHVIAAKAVALQIAKSELFAERQRRTVAGAQAVAEALLNPRLAAEGSAPVDGGSPSADAMSRSSGQGIDVLTGGTDVHLALVDLRGLQPELSGKQAEDRLHEIGITVNRNAVPFDPRPPMEASGLRIGTPALATRGLQREDFAEVGQIIAAALLTSDFARDSGELAGRVGAIVERYPLYESLPV